jgi:outer membrane protein
MRKLLVFLTITTVLCSLVSASEAANADYSSAFAKERFLVRMRGIGVLPNESSNLNIGGDLDISDAFAPEVDLSYFFTKNISLEAIAATTKHHLKHSSGANVGDAWVLPPTVTLQYHFMADQKFVPYIGAGLNYSMFYGESSAAGFTDLDVHNGVGYALQAGYDYWLDDHWGFNFDVKKLYLNMGSSVNNGAIQVSTDLDPWIVGAGISYRF